MTATVLPFPAQQLPQDMQAILGCHACDSFVFRIVAVTDVKRMVCCELCGMPARAMGFEAEERG